MYNNVDRLENDFSNRIIDSRMEISNSLIVLLVGMTIGSYLTVHYKEYGMSIRDYFANFRLIDTPIDNNKVNDAKQESE